jgi:hypothetical protein
MDLNKLKGQLQTEVDTTFLYQSIATIQSDDNLSRVLLSRAEIENGHAKHMLDKVQTIIPNYMMPLPSSRAKFQLKLGMIFGYNSIISSLSNIEINMPKILSKTNCKKGRNPMDSNTIILIL